MRYWVGAGGNSEWTDTNNWSATDGGGGGAGVPTSSDDVTMNANNGGMDCFTSGADVVCKTLTLTAAWNKTFNAGGGKVTVSGAVSIAAGSMVCGTELNVAGSITFAAGTFDASTGTITMTAAGTLTVGAGQVFNNFTLNMSGLFTLAAGSGANLTINGNVTMTAMSGIQSALNQSVTVKGNLIACSSAPTARLRCGASR